jgi:hypothetical protein
MVRRRLLRFCFQYSMLFAKVNRLSLGDYPHIRGFKTPEVFLSFQSFSLAPQS